MLGAPLIAGKELDDRNIDIIEKCLLWRNIRAIRHSYGSGIEKSEQEKEETKPKRPLLLKYSKLTTITSHTQNEKATIDLTIFTTGYL